MSGLTSAATNGMRGATFRVSMHQFNETRFAGKTFYQRFIEGCQTDAMLAGQRGEVAVSDLMGAGHQIGSDDAVGATQIVGHKLVARVGQQLTKHPKCRVGRHAVAEQRMGGNPRKSKLDHRAGGERGNALEPRAGFAVISGKGQIWPHRPSQNEFRKRAVPMRNVECGMRSNLISVFAKLRAPGHATRCPWGIRNIVAADVSRLKLLPRWNNERTDVRYCVWIGHCPVPKRRRAGALQDASRSPSRFEFPPGFGPGRPSAAFPGNHHAIRVHPRPSMVKVSFRQTLPPWRRLCAWPWIYSRFPEIRLRVWNHSPSRHRPAHRLCHP